MPAKKHTPDDIIGKLREDEIVLGQGGATAKACRRIAVNERTYHRWRNGYGGLKTDHARRIKDLEKENLRLRRAIADMTRDRHILQAAAMGIFCSPTRRRSCSDQVRTVLDLSVRRVRRVLGLHRSMPSRVPSEADDEAALPRTLSSVPNSTSATATDG